MIEDYFAGLVQDRIMEELTPFIIVGFISFIMFIGYQTTNRIDTVISKRKAR